MAKGKKSIFFCQNCGHEESKWLGQCPMCKEWNTFVEEKVSVTRGSTAAVQQVRDAKDAKVVTLSSITTDDDERMQTGILALDRVLGGGIVRNESWNYTSCDRRTASGYGRNRLNPDNV